MWVAATILRDITDLIREDKGEATPIVFTVSPIPLKATSSGYEPQVANLRSKATLLAGLHQFIDEDTARRPAAYFPAYEIFLGAPRAPGQWQGDLRHPTAAAVDYVCRRFVEVFGVPGFMPTSDVPFEVPQVAV
jgi:hypothetical protein